MMENGYKQPQPYQFRFVTCCNCSQTNLMFPLIQFYNITIKRQALSYLRFEKGIFIISSSHFVHQHFLSENEPFILCPKMELKLEPNVRQLFVKGHQVGDYAVVECNHGYHFHDGSTVRSLVCMESGRWSSSIPTCKGISLTI